MSEDAYPREHPAHPSNAGKKFSEPKNELNSDYLAGSPLRAGLGQRVPTVAGSFEPRQGFKHLHNLPGETLGERLAAFEKLPGEEQEARNKWNVDGIPVTPEEE